MQLKCKYSICENTPYTADAGKNEILMTARLFVSSLPGVQACQKLVKPTFTSLVCPAVEKVQAEGCRFWKSACCDVTQGANASEITVLLFPSKPAEDPTKSQF